MTEPHSEDCGLVHLLLWGDSRSLTNKKTITTASIGRIRQLNVCQAHNSTDCSSMCTHVQRFLSLQLCAGHVVLRCSLQLLLPFICPVNSTLGSTHMTVEWTSRSSLAEAFMLTRQAGASLTEDSGQDSIHQYLNSIDEYQPASTQTRSPQTRVRCN
jgi:hypothetical protein